MTTCPTCNSPLRLVVQMDVDIDVCDDCKGVWLDRGELGKLADQLDFMPRAITPADALHLKCPRCRTGDFRTIESHVGLLNQCPNCCGVFVGGETLDCLTQTKKPIVPKNATADGTLIGVDSLNALEDLLWFFTQN